MAIGDIGRLAGIQALLGGASRGVGTSRLRELLEELMAGTQSSSAQERAGNAQASSASAQARAGNAQASSNARSATQGGCPCCNGACKGGACKCGGNCCARCRKLRGQ